MSKFTLEELHGIIKHQCEELNSWINGDKAKKLEEQNIMYLQMYNRTSEENEKLGERIKELEEQNNG